MMNNWQRLIEMYDRLEEIDQEAEERWDKIKPVTLRELKGYSTWINDRRIKADRRRQRLDLENKLKGEKKCA